MSRHRFNPKQLTDTADICLKPVLFDVLMLLKMGALPVVTVRIFETKKGMGSFQTDDNVEAIPAARLANYTEQLVEAGYVLLARWLRKSARNRVVVLMNNVFIPFEFTGEHFVPELDAIAGAEMLIFNHGGKS